MKRVFPRPTRAEREALLEQLVVTDLLISRFINELQPGLRAALRVRLDKRIDEDVQALTCAGYWRIAALVRRPRTTS